LYVASVLALTIGLAFLFNQSPLEGEVQAFLVLGIAVGVFISLVSYPWWFDTLIEKKMPWWIKLGLVIAVFWIINIVLKSFVASAQSVSFQAISRDIPTLLYFFLLLLIPAVTYTVSIFFDFLLAILLLIRTVFGDIRAIHDPRPVKTILQLATEQIPAASSDGTSWKLLDLQETDITTLLNWSKANQDGSEKRTMPAFFVAALIGVMLASDSIRSNVDIFFTWLIENSLVPLTSRASKLFFPQIPVLFLLIFILMFTSFSIKSLTMLFRNIVAQNLIIEACIVAKHAGKKTRDSSPPSLFSKVVKFLNNHWFQ
jgi:hypothetical protein